jgi:hypothetical protein
MMNLARPLPIRVMMDATFPFHVGHGERWRRGDKMDSSSSSSSRGSSSRLADESICRSVFVVVVVVVVAVANIVTSLGHR